MTNKSEEKMWGHFSTHRVKKRIKVINWTIQIFKRWEEIAANKAISPSGALNRLIYSFQKAFMVSTVSKAGLKL